MRILWHLIAPLLIVDALLVGYVFGRVILGAW
jgi:hypothetical protein